MNAIVRWDEKSVFQLPVGETLVGRAVNCPVRQYSDVFLSRRHCTLVWDGNVLTLRDSGSENGTFLVFEEGDDPQPGPRVEEPIELTDGSKFLCGLTLFRVQLQEQAPELTDSKTAVHESR